MSFDCVYAGVALDRAPHLTVDAIADGARAHGLQSVYVVASVAVVPRRWRRHRVDVVVHMIDGDDILGTQFPDEARAAVTAAVEAILHAPRAISLPSSRPRSVPAPPPAGTARA